MEKEDWLFEDLKARNKDILQSRELHQRLTSFALLVLGSFIGFLSSPVYAKLSGWEAPVVFGLGLFFTILGHKALGVYFVSTFASDYIVNSILVRLSEIYEGCEGQELYGWEHYRTAKGQKFKASYVATAIGSAGPFLVPAMGFFLYGSLKLFSKSGLSSSALPLSLLLFTLCWMALGLSFWSGWAARGVTEQLSRRGRSPEPLRPSQGESERTSVD